MYTVKENSGDFRLIEFEQVTHPKNLNILFDSWFKLFPKKVQCKEF